MDKKKLEEHIKGDFSVQSLMDYLLENSRNMTDDEQESYNRAIDKLFKPTGRKIDLNKW